MPSLALPGTFVAAALSAGAAMPVVSTPASPKTRGTLGTTDRAGNPARVGPCRASAEAPLGRGHSNPNAQAGRDQYDDHLANAHEPTLTRKSACVQDRLPGCL
jgi:hypothetical protein